MVAVFGGSPIWVSADLSLLIGPFRAGGLVGVMWAASKIQGLVRASHLLRLILLVSFSDTLLVVSILDIVYDCHLWPLLQS